MAMGFASGIPFLLTLSTLSVWLVECGFDTKAIGMFTAVSLPYAFKFLWAPFLDKVKLPIFLNLHPIKRFGLLALISLITSLVILAQLNPVEHLISVVITATCVSFFAATHDIVLDALRIYASDPSQVGGGAASESIEAMTKASEFLSNSSKKDSIFKEYDGYNLDTGMKYRGVGAMKEFSPL
jgi:PAT family beta-lactamase induction signal transducer AmpG